MAIHPIVLGTAGHIDHGKSSLVRTLTGIDPDRLQEEKERGLTIDLGFAPWELPGGRRVGIVDVPGHERFIKNMVAGATGIDLVLFVVAADDGVMPQTREHLDIMTLLGISRGLVVLSKIDLVEPEYRELAVEEIEELVVGTFLEGAPVFPLSVVSGEGVESFRTAVEQLVLETPAHTPGGTFRMPVQRVFSASGFGTILTGIPISGHLALGERVEILPLGKTGRVRGLEAYRESVESIGAGHSSAINLSDIDYRRIHRGMVAAAPGRFVAGAMFEASLSLLPKLDAPLRHLSEVRFHCGTAEVLGQVALLQGDLLEPGGESFVQIRLQEEVCVEPGDRFILRLASPMVTLGGGAILRTSRYRVKRTRGGVVEGLERAERALDDPLESLQMLLDERSGEPVRPAEIARALRCEEAVAVDRLEQLAARDQAVAVGAGWLSARALAVIRQRILEVLERYYERTPHRLWMELRELRGELENRPAAIEAALEILAGEAVVERRAALVRACSREIPWSAKERAAADAIHAALNEAGCSPPSDAELARQVGISGDQVASLIESLEDLDRVVSIGPGMTLSCESIAIASSRITENIQRNGELIIPELRDSLETSRKFLIPMLDHFDRIGLTIRQGGRRVLRGGDRAT